MFAQFGVCSPNNSLVSNDSNSDATVSDLELSSTDIPLSQEVTDNSTTEEDSTSSDIEFRVNNMQNRFDFEAEYPINILEDPAVLSYEKGTNLLDIKLYLNENTLYKAILGPVLEDEAIKNVLENTSSPEKSILFFVSSDTPDNVNNFLFGWKRNSYQDETHKFLPFHKIFSKFCKSFAQNYENFDSDINTGILENDTTPDSQTFNNPYKVEIFRKEAKVYITNRISAVDVRIGLSSESIYNALARPVLLRLSTVDAIKAIGINARFITLSTTINYSNQGSLAFSWDIDLNTEPLQNFHCHLEERIDNAHHDFYPEATVADRISKHLAVPNEANNRETQLVQNYQVEEKNSTEVEL